MNRKWTAKAFASMVLSLMLMCVCTFAMAEDVTIPIVNITSEGPLTDWVSKEDVRDAVLSFEDPATGNAFTREITIQPQGSSSLYYPKKNFTIKMKEEGVEVVPAWGVQKKYCFKANYVDPTHACNIVSARLAAQMNERYGLHAGTPNHGAIDGFPIWVTLNGEPAGLYTWNIPKDEWLFAMDGENENHIVMCGEAHSPGVYFQTDYYELDDEWAVEVGGNNSKTVEKYARLVRFVNTSTDEEFVRDFDQYLNLDACLNYYVFMILSLGHDNDSKNMLMVTYDGLVWYPTLYDLDSLWGISSDGRSEAEGDVGWLIYSQNRLFERIRQNFGLKMVERYHELRSDILSAENIWGQFVAFRNAVPAEYFEQDAAMWNPTGELIRSYERMDQLMDAYIPVLDEYFAYKPAAKGE